MIKQETDPYSRVPGVLPKHLYGMDEVIEVTDRSLALIRQGEAAPSVMILGMESLGKSTVLTRLHENTMRQNGRLHTHYYDIWDLGVISDELVVIFGTRIGLPQWLRGAMYWLWRGIASCPWKFVQWIVNFVKMSPTKQATMVKIMVKYGKKLRKLRKGAVIFIDNLHDLSDAELKVWVTALRKIEMERLPILFVVTGHPVLLDRIRAIQANVNRLAQVHALGFLGAADVRKHLQMTAIQNSRVFTEAALEKMVDVCGGHPHVVQLMGSMVWEIAGAADMTVAHVNEALPLVREYIEDQYLDPRVQLMNDEDMAVAMVLVATPATERALDNVVARLGGERKEHVKTLSRLVKLNVLVELEPDLIGFAVPFFEEYLVNIANRRKRLG